ncbi:hypothetical protein BDP27DRAFT_1369379 [Rhodocollybia butyracea]|uniref:Uncharacterized protein n=1 Tax=Rhodocollybia butyracea TaxID=206335 RepID=A0A9P5TZP7_9AGAR|nr:hypothetical protein BDP27DRAFT_1369379 [Rhodocollybia butyracea]
MIKKCRSGIRLFYTATTVLTQMDWHYTVVCGERTTLRVVFIRILPSVNLIRDYCLTHNLTVGDKNRNKRSVPGSYDIWNRNRLASLIDRAEHAFKHPLKPPVVGWVNGNDYERSSESFGILSLSLSVQRKLGIKHYELAKRQGTRMAILPLHTSEEFAIWRVLVKQPHGDSQSQHSLTGLQLQTNGFSIAMPGRGYFISFRSVSRITTRADIMQWTFNRLLNQHGGQQFALQFQYGDGTQVESAMHTLSKKSGSWITAVEAYVGSCQIRKSGSWITAVEACVGSCQIRTCRRT